MEQVALTELKISIFYLIKNVWKSNICHLTNRILLVLKVKNALYRSAYFRAIDTAYKTIIIIYNFATIN